MRKIITTIITTILLINVLTGCAYVDGEVNELNGSITGNTYNVSFYSNEGEKFMEMSGEKINLDSNVVRERTYSPKAAGVIPRLCQVL